ncbi:MAG: pseudouridine synthase [Candidatus Coatesbacteria bacterium]
MPPNGEVLQKILARKGLCSRREADEYIRRGWVLVDGKVVTKLGTRALPSQDVRLGPEAQRVQDATVTILLNKPVGFVSGQPESDKRPAIILVTPENRDPADRGPAFEPKWLNGLVAAGRLDEDSRGLLVLTQDGRVAKRLIGEASNLEKEYLVRVDRMPTEAELARLRSGLYLDGKPLRPAGVEILNADQLRFILTEGRNRQIRRMCEQVGIRVAGLKRVRIGRVVLGSLPEGHWRLLPPRMSFL